MASLVDDNYMQKLKVYVHSFEIPTVGFVDKEGAMHACAQAQRTAFQVLKSVSSMIGNRYLPNEEREVLMLAEDFCRNNGLEFETIDLGTMSFLARLRLRIQGIKTPVITYEEKIFFGVPSEKARAHCKRVFFPCKEV